MRNYLSSRSFGTLSAGAADPDEAFVAIKELPDATSTLDCTKYAGYVVKIGDSSVGTATVTLTNLTPGAIIHIVCLVAGNAVFHTTGDVNIFTADGLLTQAFDTSLNTNSVIMTLTVLSDKLVAIGKLLN